MSKLRLGIIGCGWVAEFYGLAARNLADRCDWAWAADPNREAAEKFCRAFGGEPRVTHQGAQADALIIATPHHLHAPIYLEIAPSGVPVLIEKPLALTVAEADRMIAARDAAQGLLMVGYVNRYRPGPRALKAALDAGLIGEPLFWDAAQFCNLEGYVHGWLAKRETLGGGVWFSSSGHLLDLLLWFNGPVEQIQLETANYRIAMEGEDTQLAVVRFRNGRLATIRESWCARGADRWQAVRVFGTTGSLDMSFSPRGSFLESSRGPWDSRLILRRDNAPEEVLLNEESSGFDFTPQLAHFFDCIAQGRQPLTSAEAARDVLAAARRAEQQQD